MRLGENQFMYGKFPGGYKIFHGILGASLFFQGT
jgi:hypothetical protein